MNVTYVCKKVRSTHFWKYLYMYELVVCYTPQLAKKKNLSSQPARKQTDKQASYLATQVSKYIHTFRDMCVWNCLNVCMYVHIHVCGLSVSQFGISMYIFYIWVIQWWLFHRALAFTNENCLLTCYLFILLGFIHTRSYTKHAF